MNAADRNKVLVEAQQFARGQAGPGSLNLRGMVKGLLNLIQDCERSCGQCECQHNAARHNLYVGTCLVEDCTCERYRWNGDRGGVAVTRSGNDGGR